METIKNYLTQKSTYFGLFKILTAVGLISFAPEVENMIADAAIKLVEAALLIFGAYNTIRDERK